MKGREVRQVADGMLAKVKAKPSVERLASNIAREQAVITAMSGKITRTMRDKPPVSATYKMRMNQFVAPFVGIRGLDGQTEAYIKPDAKQAKAIFSSKVVPMNDGTELLTGAKKKTMSQFGYGGVVSSSLPSAPKVQRIGFNNTLADTSGGKITECLAGVPSYRNTAVCVDFPKGPGGASPNKMWVDGTYEETLAAIHKKQDERSKDLDLKMPVDVRRQVFNQQALAGAQVYGNELLKQNLEDEFAKERQEQIRTAVRAQRPGAPQAEIDRMILDIEAERRAGRIAQQLRLPPTSALALQAAKAQITDELNTRRRTRQIATTQAEQAEERRAAQEAARVERERRGYNARVNLAERLGGLPRAAVLERVRRTEPLRRFPLVPGELAAFRRIDTVQRRHNADILRRIREQAEPFSSSSSSAGGGAGGGRRAAAAAADSAFAQQLERELELIKGTGKRYPDA
jgi:hypothetical protein